jgi:hypothetical protein
VGLLGGPDSVGQTAEKLRPLDADILKALTKTEEVEEEAQEKLSAEEAGYETHGDFPFLCGTCMHYDGETMACEIVDGPYDGKVHPADTCERWAPSFKTLGYKPPEVPKPEEETS